MADWTSEQETLLAESYGTTTMQYLMDKLDRSEAAIKQKYRSLTGTVSPHKAAGTFTAAQVANVLGVSSRTVINWINDKSFPAKRLNVRRKQSCARKNYSIEPEKVWKWVEENKERINFTYVKKGILLPEPAWLEEEIKKAFIEPVKRPVSWSREEEDHAWFLYKSGKSITEIATQLKRPEKGTQAHLERMARKKLNEAKIGKILS